MIFFRVSSLVVLMLAVNAVQAKDLVRVQENAGDVSTRKAMLVLPGLGGSNKRSAGIAEAMNYEGYDLFIPDYKDRKSVAESVDKLAEFIRQWQLELYDEVHVYSFILGGWCLNRLLQDESCLTNLTHVVYDRGPVQERVATEMVKANKALYTFIVGDILEDFSKRVYVPNTRSYVKIGIIIETGVSDLAYKFRDGINAGKPITFSHDSLQQVHDDYLYLPMGHDAMYDVIKAYAAEVRHFFDHGQFGTAYRYQPLEMHNYKIREK